jgi:K+-sensing histidine kinase KdpD
VALGFRESIIYAPEGAATGERADVDVLLATSPVAAPVPHVLVCINGTQLDSELMRQGRVLADLLSGRLTVLYAFRPGGDGRQHALLVQERAYARSLDAQLVELPAFSEEDGIAEYARARGVTHVVLSDATSRATLVDRLDGLDWYFVRGCAPPTSRA